MKPLFLSLLILTASTACRKEPEISPGETLEGRYQAVIDPLSSVALSSSWMEIRQNWSDASYRLTYHFFDKGPYSFEGVTVQKDSLTYVLYSNNQKIGQYTFGEFRSENGTVKTWLLNIRCEPPGQAKLDFRGVKE